MTVHHYGRDGNDPGPPSPTELDAFEHKLRTILGRYPYRATSPLAATLDHEAAGFVSDHAGEALGKPVAYSRPSGATIEHALPEWRVMMGHTETVQRRSRKGRQTYRIVGRNRVPAPVTDDRSGLSHLSAIELAKLADDLLAASDPDGSVLAHVSGHASRRYLLGTLETAFAQVTPSLIVRSRKDRKRIRDPFYVSGVRPDAAGIAVHTVGAAGYLTSTSAERQLRALDTRRDRVHEIAGWPVRMRLHGRLRASERQDWSHVGRGQYVKRATMVRTLVGPVFYGVTSCLAWHVDAGRVWDGHSLTIRPPATSGKRAAPAPRPVEQIRTPERTAIARTIADGLAEGVRTFSTPRGTLTVSKGASGRHSCTLTLNGAVVGRWQARSVGAIAVRVA